MSKEVKSVYNGYPAKPRQQLLRIRELILETAAATPVVGELEETLKWSEPAYLTSKSKSGSTIRLGWKEKNPEKVAMYLNCQTTLVDTYRSLYPELQYEGNRAVLFDVDRPLPEKALRHCIEMALTYHSAKKSRK